MTPESGSDPNPLLEPWSGPAGGVPPFDRIRVCHLGPALAAAIDDQWCRVERIAADTEEPTFANTLEALERSGRLLDRVLAVLGIYTSALSDPEVDAIELQFAPKLAELRDRILQDARLYARVAAVHASASTLSPEQARLAWRYHTDFVRAGARLSAPDQARVAAINQELATLYARFGQQILGEENDEVTWLETADLAGLSDVERSACAATATAHGQPGRHAVANTRSSVEPFLEQADSRARREEVLRMFVMRGDKGDARDTNAIIRSILALRADRARLLGYATHAHWRVEDQMAKTPERALGLMRAVWSAAVARARGEVADMQALADAQAPGGTAPAIAPWDYRYYAERVRRARYDFDANELRPYLQLEKLRDGMHYTAGRLFGLAFGEIPPGEVPVYQPDVRVWRVTDRTGRELGLWYLDPYARAGKRSGAWMSEYRRQERLDGDVLAIVSNNANFVPAPAGEPLLISWDDAVTLFHEFGHALHGLMSSVTYPSLSGTSVATDFVEFPSQLLEHWLSAPEVLARFAVHHRTGEPMPERLLAKVRDAHAFNQGFKTVEYLSAALLDMHMHLEPVPPADPRAYEKQTLEALGMPPEIVMRHRTAQFSHVFSGDQYSAGYYSYLWADTLSADAWEAFAETGSAWDADVAARLSRTVFAAGGTRDPAEAYRAFRGRDPDPGALMRDRGLA